MWKYKLKSECLDAQKIHSQKTLTQKQSMLFVTGRGIKWLLQWPSGEESTCQCRRHEFSPWAGKIPWRRTWHPTPVSSWESSTDRGAWWAAVRRGPTSQTRLNMYVCVHVRTNTVSNMTYELLKNS